MVSALESEMWKAGHLDTSKIVDYRDIQNISEELSQFQVDLPICENHPLASTIATEAVAVPSSVQNTFEELSKSKVTTLNAETVRLLIPLLWRFLIDRVQNISEELSHSQGDPRVCENRSLISTTATDSVTGPSIAQSTFEEASHFQGDLQCAKAFLLLLPLLWRLFPDLLVSKTYLKSCPLSKVSTPECKNCPLASTTATEAVVRPSSVQTTFQQLSYSQGEHPECRNRPLASKNSTEAVAGPSCVQNTYQQLSYSQGEHPECRNRLLASTNSTEALAGPSSVQNTYQQLSYSQGEHPECINRPLASTNSTEAVAGPSSFQNTSEELPESQVDHVECRNSLHVFTTATETIAGPSIAQNIYEKLPYVQGDLPLRKRSSFFNQCYGCCCGSLPNIRVEKTLLLILWKEFRK
ncbi:hypothetical protein AVEN_235903-1 [Araneus ventricosus]|uniref:Uncharacterized protein n=1 Tax=Araneus ventricosus TaxID=182803 RepID=A0A4Y2NFU5_ARAVE|nr:hypothetical protein AVEN_235903-1 [Araneus ventricosus]